MSSFLVEVINRHGHKARVMSDGMLLVASVDDGGVWHIEPPLRPSWSAVYAWLGY